MDEQTIEGASYYYLDKKVMPEDVMGAYCCIEKMNNGNSEIIELEKKILINSFYYNKILFNSRAYYSGFSTLIFRLGSKYGAKKIEQAYEIMIAVQDVIFSIEEFAIKEKYQLLNIICMNYEHLYEQFIKNNKNIKSILSIIFNDIYSNLDIGKSYKYKYEIS